MERINYRITLDAHKNGIQRTLQGFEIADNMSRRISVNLTASGDTYEIPFDHVTAVMYVTTPNAKEPSIEACAIEDNTVIYDMLPITEEGITEMQMKLIETRMDGAKSVLLSPKFAIEVSSSNADDGGATQTPTFTALEDALARAKSVYDARLLRIEIDDACVFRAYYADGTVYENYALHEALYNGNALLSESWAKGGTGIREGEDTNNSMYFSNVSRSAAEDADMVYADARGLLDEAIKHTAFTSFLIDFENGNLEYLSANSTFDVNEENGDLEFQLSDDYDPEKLVGDVVAEYVEKKSKDIEERLQNVDANTFKGHNLSEFAMKNSILDSVAKIEANTEEDMIAGANVVKHLHDKTNIIKNLEGTTIVATDTAEASLEGLHLYGRSEQMVTTGAQLLDFPDMVNTHAGVTWSCENGVLKVNGTTTTESSYSSFGSETAIKYELPGQAGIFTLSSNSEKVGLSAKITSSDGNVTHYGATSFALDGTELQVIIYMYVKPGTSVNETIYPMLNKGTEALPWEPYTGGKPSPNPEYPQEIVSAGDNGSVEVGVYGKNLVNSVWVGSESTQYSGGLWLELDDLQPDTTYTISFIGAKGHSFYFNEHLFKETREFTSDGTILSFLAKTKSNIDKNNESVYLDGKGWIILKNSTGNTVVPSFTDVQFERGEVMTEYEPYRPKQTLTALTPNGLPGIKVTDASLATYTDENGQMWCADEIDFERGVYVQRIGEMVFDGSSDEKMVTEQTNTNGKYRIWLKDLQSTAKAFPNESPANALCSHYGMIRSDGFGTYGCKQGFCIDKQIKSYIYDESFNTQDVSLFKAHLTQNPIKVQYVLATPIETPLSAEELAAYKALHTNKPTTTIMNSENVHMEARVVNGIGNDVAEIVATEAEKVREEVQKNYLPLSGGTLSGNLTIDRSDKNNVNANLFVKSNARHICLAADSDYVEANAGIYDEIRQNWVLRSCPDGAVEIPHNVATHNLTSRDVYPDNKNSRYCGLATAPWLSMYSNNYYLRKNDVTYGTMYMSEGTTSSEGLSLLELGNANATGTTGNAKGQIRMYGQGSAKVYITPNSNMSQDVGITLPSSSGTLARLDDLANKATLNEDVRFIGVNIGKEGTYGYIYASNDDSNIYFRYKDSSGNMQFTNIRDLHAKAMSVPTFSLNGTTLTITT